MTRPIANREYDIGDSCRTTAYFKVSGVPADPTTVTLRYKRPDGTSAYVTTPDAQIVNDEVGTYYADILLNASGDWYYRWEGTGSVTAARERRLSVRVSEF